MTTIFPSLLNAADDTNKFDHTSAVSYSVVSWKFCHPRPNAPLYECRISTKQIRPIVFIKAYQHYYPNNHLTMIAPTHRIKTLGIGSKVWANGQSLGVILDIESVQNDYLTYLLWEHEQYHTLTVHKSFWSVLVCNRVL
jgi:hypothetical protein